MPITANTKAGAAKYRRRKKMDHASLASGELQGQVESSDARFLSARVHIEDYRYVDDREETEALITAAKQRLMWGHRLVRREPPFVEITARWDNVAAGLDVKEALLKEKQRIARERMKQKRMDWKWLEGVKSSPLKQKKVIPQQVIPKKLKTAAERREARIAALRKALANQ